MGFAPSDLDLGIREFLEKGSVVHGSRGGTYADKAGCCLLVFHVPDRVRSVLPIPQ